jgi:hypothetical protein
MLIGAGGLCSLDWCRRCAPSGGSAKWEVCQFCEEMEMINKPRPNLEHLGMLGYLEGQIVDAVINGTKSEVFTLSRENTFSGLFPHLTNVTCHLSQERDAGKPSQRRLWLWFSEISEELLPALCCGVKLSRRN